jgi:hypothetical protein
LHDIIESQGRFEEPQAAPAHWFAVTMARLFSPCTRLHNHLLESRLEVLRELFAPEPFQELNLDKSTEQLLSAESAFTYGDLYAMSGLGNEDTLAWLTPHAAVSRETGLSMNATEQVNEWHRFYFNADGKVMYAIAFSLEYLFEICDVVLRLLAVSVVHSLEIYGWTPSNDAIFINAPTLGYLMAVPKSEGFNVGETGNARRSLPCARGVFEARPRDCTTTLYNHECWSKCFG